MLKGPIKANIRFTGGGPMQISERATEDTSGLSRDQNAIVRQVGETVDAYLKSAEELLNGKYAALRDSAPPHLADRGNVLAACCADGAVIRYERKANETNVMAGWVEQDLPDVASLFSENVIHCYFDRNYTSTVPTTGTEFRLCVQDRHATTQRQLASARIGFDAVIEKPECLPQPPHKPFCLLSVRNTCELQLVGQFVQDDPHGQEGRQFVMRTPFRLPVGWQCIEVFPFFRVEDWKPEYATVWAETDLLAAVAAHQCQERQFESLDPNAAARKEWAQRLQSFKDLLDSDPQREEVLQSFLRRHPFLLCPTYTRMWPKLALGKWKTDFVFCDATQEYLLVELERSTLPLFVKDGHTSSQLNHACGQIQDWKRYLEDNLTTVQCELDLTGISANPRSLVVIGRSATLTRENRRKLTTIENGAPKTKILTYDDVYENAKAVLENLFGHLWDIEGETRIYYLPRTQ